MVISTQHLRKLFGDFVAVDDVTLEIPAGQIFGFLGPNGSGKTTTIRMLLGLLKPSGGTAYVLGKDVSKTSHAVLQQIGYMSQKFSLYTDLTVEENLRFFGQSYGLFNAKLRERIDFILDMAGLKEHRRALTSELSGGWAQRLALGAAIMHKPKLLFLDEPTAGVDPVSRREFWDLLYQLAQQGTTIFVTTHYMDEAEHCERVAFIYYGRLIADGSPQEIVAETVPGQVITFEPPDPPHAMKLIEDAVKAGKIQARGVELFGAAVHIASTDVSDTQDYIQTVLPKQGVSVDELHIISPSLEDAFITLVKEQTPSA
jgi:ABC-2 type transport system ATP-binding protein